MFWILATAIALVAAITIIWPLLREGGIGRNYTFALVILIPIMTLLLYQKTGTPDGINVNGRPVPQSAAAQGPQEDQIGGLVRQLEERLRQSPDDLQGWLLLGRTYKTMQQYEAAHAALDHALALAPDDPLVIVEVAEAMMFVSGSPAIGEEQVTMLERALSINPDQQKALWLLGFAASQSGDDERAIELWQHLLAQMDPAGGTSDAVQTQLDEARARLGIEATPAWQGIQIDIVAPSQDYIVSAGAVLFVIARRPGIPGPPLGVRRIQNPVFPLRILLNDRDSMVPEAPVSSANPIQLLARLSLSGSPTASQDDLQSQAVETGLETDGSVSLKLALP